MSVRKREWTTPSGEAKSAWVVDYFDTNGTRRLKTFRLKKEADQFAATASVEVREGVHVADSASSLWRRPAPYGLPRVKARALSGLPSISARATLSTISCQ